MNRLVVLEMRESVAVLHLNRPEKRNAVNDELRAELIDGLEGIAGDRSVRALVLTGNGNGFCAGGDVSAMAGRLELPPSEVGVRGWERQQRVHRAQSLLHELPIPTIAAVNGAAAGLGADMAMACDFVVASSAAAFTWSYIHRGLIADGGGLYLLPRRVGLARTKELIFSGRKVEAQEALRLGIADRISSPEGLLAEAVAWAEELTKGSRTAIALGKAMLNQSFETSLASLFAQGSQAQALCYTSTEHRESVVAFLQNMPPTPGKGDV